MSKTEAVKGKIKKITPNEGQSLDDVCKEICEERDIKLDSWNESWINQLREDLYDEYIFVGDDLYFFIKKQDLDPYGFSDATLNEDGTIDFIVMWYNGGASLSEVVEEAIKRIT